MRPIYAGSFDPVTEGHLDIMRRARDLFGDLVVAVGHNPAKRYWFDLEQRIALIQESLPGTTVVVLEGLLVQACAQHGADAIIRGIRSASDFDLESRYGLANRDLAGVETIFLQASATTQFISSSLVKEIHMNGGDISRYVPPGVLRAMNTRRAAEP